MDDAELLEAMRQIVREETTELLKPIKEELNEIRVIVDVDLRRDVRLLSEGHEAILNQLPVSSKAEDLEDRLSAVEVAVKTHSRDIRELKRAQ